MCYLLALDLVGHGIEMDTVVDIALARLRGLMRESESALVAFSGGVDSALVVKIAYEVLGPRAVAFTANSSTLPPEESLIAQQFTAEVGIEHVMAKSQELDKHVYMQGLAHLRLHNS